MRQSQFMVPKKVIDTLSNFEGPDDNGSATLLKNLPVFFLYVIPLR